MDFNSILIGSEDPKRLIEYYTKLFGAPIWEGRLHWVATRERMDNGGTPRSGQGSQRPSGKDHLEHRDRRCKGRVRSAQVRRWRCRPGAIRTWGGNADRHLCRPDDNYFQLISPMTEMTPSEQPA